MTAEQFDVQVHCATHRGAVRDTNQDAVGVSGWALHGSEGLPLTLTLPVRPGFSAVVCDGMGGHDAGEEAARFVAEHVTRAATFGDLDSPDAIAEQVSLAVQSVSDALVDRSEASGQHFGMGCTVVGFSAVESNSLTVFNVGDSIAYLWKNGMLARQTKVDRAVEGQSTLTQAIGGGTRTKLVVHHLPLPLEDGIAVLLCSDGLTDLVSEANISTMLEGGGPAVTQKLIEAALSAGGHDNITVVLAEFTATTEHATAPVPYTENSTTPLPTVAPGTSPDEPAESELPTVPLSEGPE